MATMAATFHIAPNEFRVMPIGDAYRLLDVAANDTATYLGAALAALDYPVSGHEMYEQVVLRGLSSPAVDSLAFWAPWEAMQAEAEKPSDSEIAAAEAALEASIKFH